VTCPNPARGFTLVEVLVALGVLSIAALALLNVQGAGASVSSTVRDRLLAEIVAENVLIEAVSTPDEAVLGEAAGEVVLAGQSWHWRKTTAATSDRDIRRIDVVVGRGPEDAAVAALTAFRGLK
jgi:general secretion pathway protein I